MTKLSLTMACGAYDRMQALQDGLIQPEGIALDYTAMPSPPEIIDEFDVSEMSLSTYLTLKSRGDFPYIAIPVFPLRLFPHSYCFVNKQAGITGPADLAGRRIGIMQQGQTVGLWFRGLLQYVHGIGPESVLYIEGGVNTPLPPDDRIGPQPLGDVGIEHVGDGKTLNAMLEAGDIDAYCGIRLPRALRTNPSVVGRLFADPRAAASAYYQRTGIFPIMTVLVMREAIHARHPWVAESLFKACDAAKHWAIEQMRFSGALRYMLPWLLDDIDEMDRLFGRDPWPYGVPANEKTLDLLAQLLVEQRFVTTKPDIQALFAPIVAWAE